MKNTPFIAVTSQPVPYHADTTAIFNTLCQQNSNSLLLDSAEIGSKNSLQSLILINAAVKITCLGNQVTFRALNANGKQVLNEIHPVLSQLGTVSAVNFDGVLWLQVVMNNDLEEGTHFRLPEDGTVLKIESLPYSINN
ncbi:MAG: hypothetical protein HXM21_00935 [Haemophilus influenzae]|nr:hypothetical protein [Haemophilus influenzae]